MRSQAPCHLLYKLYSKETPKLKPDELAEVKPSLLTYPLNDKRLARFRAAKLTEFGIKRVLLGGWQEVGGLGVLGKGKSSIVLACESNIGLLAAKIRRIDSTKPSLEKESEILKLANKAGVGPTYIVHDPDILVTRLVVGVPVELYLSGDYQGSIGDSRLLINLILSALVKARRLDEAGIEHGELSDPRRHIIVTCTGYTEIIDFESSRLKSRPSNVTKLAQAFLIGGSLADVVAGELDVDRDRLISVLRNYKRNPTDSSFKEVVNTILSLKPSKHKR